MWLGIVATPGAKGMGLYECPTIGLRTVSKRKEALRRREGCEADKITK